MHNAKRSFPLHASWLGLAILISTFSCTKTGAPLAREPNVTLAASDGVPVTATWYKINDSATYIILCHQAGYSKGEYKDVAPQLNALGFNCVAVDLRSGGDVNGVPNETAEAAERLGKPMDYLSAERDIQAAIHFAYRQNHRKVILFGSSYSASLALKLAAEDSLVLGAIAFSPGEYFGDKLNLAKTIRNLSIPAFLTGARKESESIANLLPNPHPSSIVQFVPQQEGIHGASALWSSTPNRGEYWAHLKLFLQQFDSFVVPPRTETSSD